MLGSNLGRLDCRLDWLVSMHLALASSLEMLVSIRAMLVSNWDWLDCIQATRALVSRALGKLVENLDHLRACMVTMVTYPVLVTFQVSVLESIPGRNPTRNPGIELARKPPLGLPCHHVLV